MNYLRCLLTNVKKPKININNFTVKQPNPNHPSFENHIKRGNKFYLLHDNKYNNKVNEIGYINYNPATGQIGLLWLDHEYRGYGIGKQMFGLVAEDAKKDGHNKVFAVTTYDHKFIKNLPNSKWKEPAGEGVKSGGYSIPVDGLLTN